MSRHVEDVFVCTVYFYDKPKISKPQSLNINFFSDLKEYEQVSYDITEIGEWKLDISKLVGFADTKTPDGEDFRLAKPNLEK